MPPVPARRRRPGPGLQLAVLLSIPALVVIDEHVRFAFVPDGVRRAIHLPLNNPFVFMGLMLVVVAIATLVARRHRPGPQGRTTSESPTSGFDGGGSFSHGGSSFDGGGGDGGGGGGGDGGGGGC